MVPSPGTFALAEKLRGGFGKKKALAARQFARAASAAAKWSS
jgi:hypothetical protein